MVISIVVVRTVNSVVVRIPSRIRSEMESILSSLDFVFYFSLLDLWFSLPFTVKCVIAHGCMSALVS